MKTSANTIHFIFYLFFLFLFLTSCQEAQVLAKETIITGQSFGKKYFSHIRCKNQYGIQKADLAADNFRFVAKNRSPAIFHFSTDRQTQWLIYLEPGDSIHFTFDHTDLANSLNSLKFSGNRVEENQLLKKIKKLFVYDIGNNASFFNCSEGELLEKIAALKQQGFDLIKGFNQNKDFLDLTKQYINYTCATYLNDYKDILRNQFAKKQYTASKKFTQAANALPLEQVDLLALPAYTDYLHLKIHQYAKEILHKDTSLQQQEGGLIMAKKQVIQHKLHSVPIKEYATFAILQQELFSRLDGAEEHYQTFMTTVSDTLYKDFLRQAYSEYSPYMRGKEAPTFSYPDIEGQLHSLPSYQGKYVYIDVWATWCGPCLKERPAFESLMKKYQHHDDLVFMGISIDEHKEAWRKMVIERQIKGIQLIADKGWQSEISKQYKIKGIPRFLLINKDGTIYDIDAPRPSSMKINRVLRKLLK